jgi:hypothetical protein
MALGLTLTATLTNGDRMGPAATKDWLSRASVWFEAVGDAVLDSHLNRDIDDKPHLKIQCHPAADAIDVRLGSSGRLKLVAKTTPAGPGYHRYLCDLLRQFAKEFEFEWERPPGDHDPGFYFSNGDVHRLESLFNHWLSGRCQQVLAKVKDGGGPYSVGLPRGVRYLHPGPVLTPLGPLPLAWLKLVAADETAGTAFFPWREPSLDCAFYKGRALTRLWLDYHWRPPRTEDEGEMVDQIAADLANALDADDDAELPWNAWLEVIAAIEADRGRFTVEPIAPEMKTLIAERANNAEPIGYRRHPVRVPLTGEWTIDVPGHFASHWNDDGLTWSAWDGPRTVWFRSIPVNGQSAASALAVGRANLPLGEAVQSQMHKPVLGEAIFGPHAEEGQNVHRLSGIAAAEGQIAACNIYVQDLEDKTWAIDVWQSLRQD